MPTPVSSLFQEVGKGFGVADNRVACEAQRLERSLGGGLVTATTGIGDNHRNEAQVRSVAGGRAKPSPSGIASTPSMVWAAIDAS